MQGPPEPEQPGIGRWCDVVRALRWAALTMNRSPLIALAVVALFTVACSSDVTGGTGGGDGEGSGGGASQGGADPSCDPGDQACVCDGCEGVCHQPCNYPSWSCDMPVEPGADQFACGDFAACDADQACVASSPQMDGCSTHTCVDLPGDCVASPSCACIAPYIDDEERMGGPLSCDDGDGHVEVSGFDVHGTPWDAPWCGDATCAGAESCWACVTDGGTEVDNHLCRETDPSAMAAIMCTRVWAP